MKLILFLGKDTKENCFSITLHVIVSNKHFQSSFHSLFQRVQILLLIYPKWKLIENELPNFVSKIV